MVFQVKKKKIEQTPLVYKDIRNTSILLQPIGSDLAIGFRLPEAKFDPKKGVGGPILARFSLTSEADLCLLSLHCAQHNKTNILPGRTMHG